MSGQSFTLSNQASDLSLSGATQGTYLISPGSPGTSFITFVATGETTQVLFVVTPAGYPSARSWESSNHTVKVSNVNALGVTTLAIAVGVVNKSGTIQATGANTATQLMVSSGLYTFTPVPPSWGTRACSDRLFYKYTFENVLLDDETVKIDTGVSNSTHTSPIVPKCHNGRKLLQINPGSRRIVLPSEAEVNQALFHRVIKD